MTRLDRALGIVLALRDGQTHPARELADRFEVSPRTIFRDVDLLGSLGVPVYAQHGRGGGFRLMAGYFLPPVTLTSDEAVSLLLAVTMLRSLRARPFAAALDAAERKLLAAIPDHLRTTLQAAERRIGFEAAPLDAFHGSLTPPLAELDSSLEGERVSLFVRAALERRCVSLGYRSSSGRPARTTTVSPFGVFWDRGLWYLVGRPLAATGRPRLWRADRVVDLTLQTRPAEVDPDFDVRDLLGRAWLSRAMSDWRDEAPVRIRITAAQAALLRRDWYYQHAAFRDLPDGAVELSFGEENPYYVLPLLRWLGPGAELIEPASWRTDFAEQVRAMTAAHASPSPRDRSP